MAAAGAQDDQGHRLATLLHTFVSGEWRLRGRGRVPRGQGQEGGLQVTAPQLAGGVM